MKKFFHTHCRRHKNGFTLVEILFYIFLLVLLFGDVIQALLTIVGTFQQVDKTTTVNKSAVFGIERIVRETRNASDIIEINSSFETNSGALSLSIPTASGIDTKTFFLSGNRIHIEVNGDDRGSITPANVVIDKFVLNHIVNGTTSEAVRMTFTLHPKGDESRVTTFYDTVVTRNSY